MVPDLVIEVAGLSAAKGGGEQREGSRALLGLFPETL